MKATSTTGQQGRLQRAYQEIRKNHGPLDAMALILEQHQGAVNVILENIEEWEIDCQVAKARAAGCTWQRVWATACILVVALLLRSSGRVQGLRDEVTHQAVVAAIHEGTATAGRILALANSHPTEAAAQVRQVTFIPLTSANHATRLLATEKLVSSDQVDAIADGIDRYHLVPDYDEYMKVLAAAFLALSQHGDALLQSGRIAEAITVFQYIKDRQPRDSIQQPDDSIDCALGELLRMAKRYPEAVAVYDEAKARGFAKEDPKLDHYAGFALYMMAKDAQRNGDKPSAKKYCLQAIGRYEAALATAKAIAESQGKLEWGDYNKVHHNLALAYLLLAELSTGDRALQYRQSADQQLDLALAGTLKHYAKEHDDNPHITFSLGLLYHLKGDTDLALTYLEKAMQKDRVFVVRTENDENLRDWNDPSHPNDKLAKLLAKYRPPKGSFGPRLPAWDPEVFEP